MGDTIDVAFPELAERRQVADDLAELVSRPKGPRGTLSRRQEQRRQQLEDQMATAGRKFRAAVHDRIASVESRPRPTPAPARTAHPSESSMSLLLEETDLELEPAEMTRALSRATSQARGLADPLAVALSAFHTEIAALEGGFETSSLDS